MEASNDHYTVAFVPETIVRWKDLINGETTFKGL